MPFKSKAQRAKLAMMTEQGEFPKEKFQEFASATGNKKLPERVTPRVKAHKRQKSVKMVKVIK